MARANRASVEIDSKGTVAILRTIQEQDALVPAAIRREIPRIAKAVNAAVSALRRGGRIIYVGAGSSGRVAMMDAAEIPPTFGTPPETIQAVIAGGPRAFARALESAEDDPAQGRRDMIAKKIGPRDLVVALSASGTTAYTVAALAYARSRRAVTVAITSNPASPLARAAHIAIVPQTGPEVVAGSTRMKAALAQKMVLHMISTSVMILLGNVYRNYMVGVRPTNRKLWQRACSIIEDVTGADRRSAQAILKQAGNDVKIAIVMLRRGIGRAAALNLLRQNGGNLRAIEQSAIKAQKHEPRRNRP